MVPTTWEAEAGGLLELRRSGLQSPMFVPLYSSLGKSEILSFKTNYCTDAFCTVGLFQSWSTKVLTLPLVGMLLKHDTKAVISHDSTRV